MATNLPSPNVVDSAQFTKQFFDSYGNEPLEFPASDVEAAISFFQTRGFDRDAAEITAAVMLKQAKLDNMPVFELLDTLKKLDGLQISALIAEILNNNRPSSSVLGYRRPLNQQDIKVRNVAA
jgi:hypothetical protein